MNKAKEPLKKSPTQLEYSDIGKRVSVNQLVTDPGVSSDPYRVTGVLEAYGSNSTYFALQISGRIYHVTDMLADIVVLWED